MSDYLILSYIHKVNKMEIDINNVNFMVNAMDIAKRYVKR